MLKKIFIALMVLLAACSVLVLANLPEQKLKRGDQIDPLVLKSVVGADVQVPSPTARLVHLQFRRFAGCPICNLHMHSIIDRHDELTSVGIKEVVVFHSPAARLEPYQGKFPFDVVGDPERKLYDRFGIGESKMALLDPRVWPALVRAMTSKDNPEYVQDAGGPWTRPAEFLIDPFGKIIASHYGAHAYDQWSVDEIIENARR